MTGAGISVSAGIPDFRSPKTGLYANLKKYDLPYPEAIFTLKYFLEKPQPFYTLASSFLDLDNYEATPAHQFAKLIQNKGML
jgi:NAD-dependent SIR2 family protein deacetylase